MKKYTKPEMLMEMFVTHEFFSACGNTNLACLNMNPAKVVYYDKNGNGKLDDEEKVDSNKYKFKEQQDCNTTGDATGGKHSSSSLGSLVFVGYGNYPYTYTAAYMVNDVKKDAPHFLSVETVNHS